LRRPLAPRLALASPSLACGRFALRISRGRAVRHRLLPRVHGHTIKLPVQAPRPPSRCTFADRNDEPVVQPHRSAGCLVSPVRGDPLDAEGIWRRGSWTRVAVHDFVRHGDVGEVLLPSASSRGRAGSAGLA
jgi:hypothetical protein